MDENRRCTAHSSSGERCKKAAILGGNVCQTHGGGAPQVRAAAMRRLEAAAEKATERLIQLSEQDEDRSVALRASDSIIDRVIGRPRQGVDLGDGTGTLRLLVDYVSAPGTDPDAA